MTPLVLNPLVQGLTLYGVRVLVNVVTVRGQFPPKTGGAGQLQRDQRTRQMFKHAGHIQRARPGQVKLRSVALLKGLGPALEISSPARRLSNVNSTLCRPAEALG